MSTAIQIKMTEGCQDLLPTRAHADDAAHDLKARAPADIPPGETQLVPTGVFMELPVGLEAQVRPRSGLALKHGITVLNSPGTVDAGYRGEVGVILHNCGSETFHIERGDRVAQMVIQRVPEVELQPVDELSTSIRGEAGFGSTGHN